jgi:hypothetical protein
VLAEGFIWKTAFIRIQEVSEFRGEEGVIPLALVSHIGVETHGSRTSSFASWITMGEDRQTKATRDYPLPFYGAGPDTLTLLARVSFWIR